MGGTNPYIEQPEITFPTQRYKLTFLPDGTTVEIDPEALPEGTGQPGSILAIARAHGVDIDHACGGVCACSTCHIYVKQGLETCNEATDAEEDQLDNARGLEPTSRLSCQCVPDGTKDVVVEIPSWNRNMVKEADHDH